jgi:hypothetical protein
MDHFKDMIARLDLHRRNLDVHKNHKLLMNWRRKGDYRDEELGTIVEGLKRNMKHLHEALRQYGPSDIKQHLLDVSNYIDFLWDALELKKY